MRRLGERKKEDMNMGIRLRDGTKFRGKKEEIGQRLRESITYFELVCQQTNLTTIFFHFFLYSDAEFLEVLNSATVKELQELQTVGVKRAKMIFEWRELHGNFSSVRRC